VLVEVDLIGVVRQQRELDIVSLGDGAAEPGAVNVADIEVFEKPSEPSFLHSTHRAAPTLR